MPPFTLSTIIAQKGLKDGLIAYLKAIGVVTTFNSFGRASKITLFVMFFLGIVMLAFFWATDVGYDVRIGPWDIKRFGLLRTFDENWMHTHAYVPNILAGVTGFLIGAPVAAVILSGFTTQREENASLAKINDMSLLAWRNFREAVLQFSTPERLHAVQNGWLECNEKHNTALNYTASIINLIRIGHIGAIANPTQVRTIEDAHTQLIARYLSFQESVDKITKALVNRETIETEWSAVVGAWQLLDQFVRLQRLEQNLLWFLHREPAVDAEIRKLMRSDPNPLAGFAELHGHSPDSPFAARTMVNTANTVRNYGIIDTDELTQALSSANEHYFGIAFVAGYGTAASDASHFLTRLNHCVQRIIDCDWPACASKPNTIDHENGTFALKKKAEREAREAHTAEEHRIAAIQYHEKLRRRPKGARSGSNLYES